MSREKTKENKQKEPLIYMRDVHKVYHTGSVEYEALRGINLTVHEGEFCAIMGPSGSGKTTLMNIIGLLDTFSSGTYELMGVESSDLSDVSRATLRNRSIGFIFQSFNLLPQMNLVDNVALPMLYGGVGAKERKERAQEALERVKLGKWMHHSPTEISGGQQQRVAVARAMVMNPPILLADEPTGNLDSKTTEEMLDLFHQVHEEGVTLIVITHDDHVGNHAERLIEIFDGRVRHDIDLTQNSIYDFRDDKE